MPPHPQTTRNSVMEARQKNITTTLPHVNRTLTDPAAGGCRPRAVPASAEVHPYLPARIHYTSALAVHTRCTTPSRCHGQRAPTHRHTARAHPLHRRPRAVTANAHPLTNTPPHRQCVHAKHRPHASGDQAAYSAWPSNHAVQQDMHSANRQS